MPNKKTYFTYSRIVILGRFRRIFIFNTLFKVFIFVEGEAFRGADRQTNRHTPGLILNKKRYFIVIFGHSGPLIIYNVCSRHI